ncbi:MAG TPA: tetratricopeptide repeat protein [Verrucomicrobiae bacterium]|jgi:tetratricopeptide (TPR) repeat protein|nr:tetratricopeptide repeat protein [Verrucomicrobiae bacterium]
MKVKAWLTGLVFCVAAAAWADNATDWKKLNHDGKKALEKNDFATAEKLLLQAADKATNFDLGDERYAESLEPLGHAAVQLRHYTNADMAYARLVEADSKRLGTNSLKVAWDLMQVTEVASYEGEFERGQEALERAISMVTAVRGAVSPAMGMCWAQKGGFELQQQHFLDAETDYKKALPMLEQTGVTMHFSGADLQMKQSYFDPPQVFAIEIMNNLAICQRKEEKYAEAEKTLRDAIKLVEWKYGGDAAHLVTPLANLAATLLDEHKFPEAKDTADRALGILRKINPSLPLAKQLREIKAMAQAGKAPEQP